MPLPKQAGMEGLCHQAQGVTAIGFFSPTRRIMRIEGHKQDQEGLTAGQFRESDDQYVISADTNDRGEVVSTIRKRTSDIAPDGCHRLNKFWRVYGADTIAFVVYRVLQ
jgi:hypothetical protein